jgi:nucleoside 2-deoxyribosyltransferase
VGYEIGYALSLGKPVLCCYQQGLRVSKMISGNSNPDLQTHAYQTTAEAVHLVQTYISELGKKG